MLIIRNVRTVEGTKIDYTVDSKKEFDIDVEGKFLILPGVLDSHIFLGEAGSSSWAINLYSAISGGVTTVFDFPDSAQPCTTAVTLKAKQQLIYRSLAHLQLPINYQLYAKAEEKQFDQIGLGKNYIAAAAIMVDSPTQSINDQHWDKIFRIAAWEDIPVIINALNENTQRLRFRQEEGGSLLEKALFYAQKQNARLYFLNLSTQSELNLINEAKKKSILVYTETTPEHLFSNDPEKEFLWESIDSRMIDMIGSGFHSSLQPKQRLIMNKNNFSINNPFLLLPQLLTAYKNKKITMERVMALTRNNLKDLYNIAPDHNAVLVDLDHVCSLKSIGGYQEEAVELTGWPVYMILNGLVFIAEESGYKICEAEQAQISQDS